MKIIDRLIAAYMDDDSPLWLAGCLVIIPLFAFAVLGVVL